MADVDGLPTASGRRAPGTRYIVQIVMEKLIGKWLGPISGQSLHFVPCITSV